MNQLIKDAALVLRALNNKTRIKVMDFLRSKGKTTVTEVYTGMRIEQSVASQHLAILRKAGVVKTERDGKFIYYQLCDPRINEITDLCSKIIGTKTKVMEDDD